MKKIFIKIIVVVLFVSNIFIFSDNETIFAAKVDTYTESPHNLVKFKKKGKCLVVKSKYPFMKNNKSSKKKTIKFKISKKCKWRFKNDGNRFPEYKGVQKFKYKKMKKAIYEDMEIPDNGYHTLVIKVKNKKIISVTYESI